jgi:tRNA(Ile)-lysidine synthase
MGDPGLQQSELISGSEATGAARLRAWLRAGGYQAPDHASVEEFVRQLRSAVSDASPRLACSAYTLQRYRDVVYRLPELAAVSSGASMVIEPGGCLEVVGVGNIRLQRTSGSGLRLSPGETPSVCWRSGGERCRLIGRSGHRSLKHLMQDWDIPPWWRGRIPLLYLEEEMLAVGDLAYCDSSRWCAKPEEGEYLWNISWERPANSRSV